MENLYRDGTDLILSADGTALGYSTGCKISTTAETKSRNTKEQGQGKWDSKSVGKLSEQITSEGYEVEGTRLGYDTLKEKMVAGEPIDVTYGYVGETDAYGGKYLITSLELDGQAGDDVKFSITLENQGAINKITTATAITRTTGNSAAS